MRSLRLTQTQKSDNPHTGNLIWVSFNLLQTDIVPAVARLDISWFEKSHILSFECNTWLLFSVPIIRLPQAIAARTPLCHRRRCSRRNCLRQSRTAARANRNAAQATRIRSKVLEFPLGGFEYGRVTTRLRALVCVLGHSSTLWHAGIRTFQQEPSTCDVAAEKKTPFSTSHPLEKPFFSFS